LGKIGSYSIPATVTNIGPNAFSGCTLTSVTIPNGVATIGDSAFSDCEGLTNMTIGNNVPSIGYGAFEYSTNFTSLTIPNNVTNIGPSAFLDCTSLTSVTIPDSVTFIRDSAFALCSSLTTVTIPNSITSIGDGAFWFCTSLTNVMLGNSLTAADRLTIGGYALAYCTNLTEVTFGNSLATIGHTGEVFWNCYNLAGLYFQGNAPHLGGDFFEGTHAKAYYLPGTTGWGPTFGGIPTAFWTLPSPLIMNGSLGVQSNEFGFTVSWATNLSVVVEAATDLGNAVWSPLAANFLNGGTYYFSDPHRTNYQSRFYRVRSQ
jgi:hypothetical protein